MAWRMKNLKQYRRKLRFDPFISVLFYWLFLGCLVSLFPKSIYTLYTLPFWAGLGWYLGYLSMTYIEAASDEK